MGFQVVKMGLFIVVKQDVGLAKLMGESHLFVHLGSVPYDLT